MADPRPTPPVPHPDADPAELARSATLDELQRMKAAEELHRLRSERTARRSRFALAGPALVGYVALAGLMVNAYQSWTNKQQQEHRDRTEQEKWNKEFARASQADKYRAFFETSMLATDSANADKRLVGYALLQEFVRDPVYDEKAIDHARGVALPGAPGRASRQARRRARAPRSGPSSPRSPAPTTAVPCSGPRAASTGSRASTPATAIRGRRGRWSTSTSGAWSGAPRWCAGP